MPNNNEFDASRLPVPCTNNLQARIIADTENMPQYVDVFKKAYDNKNQWRWFPALAFPLAACFLIAVIVSLNLDNAMNSGSDLGNPLVVNEDSNWQEIMLREDEWLLADL